MRGSEVHHYKKETSTTITETTPTIISKVPYRKSYNQLTITLAPLAIGIRLFWFYFHVFLFLVILFPIMLKILLEDSIYLDT